MRIVYHLGAHCTDEDRLVRCLLKNRAVLAEAGIAVPSPTRYRKLLRDTATQLRGAAASQDTQAMILDQIIDDGPVDRLILSWTSFLSFPAYAVGEMLYANGGQRLRGFTRIFPDFQAEFHLGLRNPATFLPLLYDRLKPASYGEFLAGADPFALRWSDVVGQILDANPDAPLTVWCDEDTPLIWPEVLQAVSGLPEGTPLEGEEDLVASLMSGEGLTRMNTYIAGHPPQTVLQRRKIVSAFLDKFALPERIELEFEMPGWTEDMVEDLTALYEEDVARIAAMPEVTFLHP